MFNFPLRSSQAEILDDFELKGNDLAENLRELEKVNALLGGHSIVKSGIARLAAAKSGNGNNLSIVDAGCGGGDALRMLARWGKTRPFEFELIGVDANAEAIKYAKKHSAGISNIRFHQINILSPEFAELQADIVMFNLFLHHFDEEQIVGFLKSCKSNGSAILINDLQRSRLAYHSFRLVSRLLRFSYIGRHDGKLSVKKSFTKKDWQRMLKKAGIDKYEIQWRWAFRYLVLIG